ncbi:MAG: hypothetical protein HKO59_11095 [Phycisphaerales bacterium]|nr:hypothetical protein [Phycisphaerales bacterium]
MRREEAHREPRDDSTQPHGDELPPLLVDYRTTAKLLSVSRRTIESLAAAGVLRKVNIGTPGSRRPVVRFVYAELKSWIDEIANGGTP